MNDLSRALWHGPSARAKVAEGLGGARETSKDGALHLVPREFRLPGAPSSSHPIVCAETSRVRAPGDNISLQKQWWQLTNKPKDEGKPAQWSRAGSRRNPVRPPPPVRVGSPATGYRVASLAPDRDPSAGEMTAGRVPRIDGSLPRLRRIGRGTSPGTWTQPAGPAKPGTDSILQPMAAGSTPATWASSLLGVTSAGHDMT